MALFGKRLKKGDIEDTALHNSHRYTRVSLVQKRKEPGKRKESYFTDVESACGGVDRVCTI